MTISNCFIDILHKISEMSLYRIYNIDMLCSSKNLTVSYYNITIILFNFRLKFTIFKLQMHTISKCINKLLK